MKKIILGCAFIGGSFAIGSSFVNSNKMDNEKKIEKYTITCGPEATCTITYYCNGFGNPPTGQDVFEGISYLECKRRADAAAAMQTCE